MATAAPLEEVFTEAVKQLVRHQQCTVSIADALVSQGLSCHEPAGQECAPESSTYWYTSAGANGWKLQRQIIRQGLSRTSTGLCRFLNERDVPVAYGTEEASRWAIHCLSRLSRQLHQSAAAAAQAQEQLAARHGIPSMVDASDYVDASVYCRQLSVGTSSSRSSATAVQYCKVESWLAAQGARMAGMDLDDSLSTWSAC